jgi:hypothetical protein
MKLLRWFLATSSICQQAKLTRSPSGFTLLGKNARRVLWVSARLRRLGFKVKNLGLIQENISSQAEFLW